MAKHEEIVAVAHACIDVWNREGWEAAYERFYAPDAVKVEPLAWSGQPNEVVGAQVAAEHEAWLAENWVDVNSVSISEGPFIGATGFAVIISSDFTMKHSGERHIFREVAVFTVDGDKIVREEFLYDEAEFAQNLRLNEAGQEASR